MTTPGPAGAEPTRLDLRLVPAALTAWLVTAAGIIWDLGGWLATGSLALGAAWWTAAHQWGTRYPWLRAASAGVLGVTLVGAGFGVSIALRCHAVQTHPLTGRFGTEGWVALTALDAARRAGPARVMFGGELDRFDDINVAGKVTVFGSGVDFGQLVAGQPVRFRARVSRPARPDLSVAVLTATGRPRFGEPAAPYRVAQVVRERFAAVAMEALPVDQAAMVPGLVLGDTSALPPSVIADFRTAGLTHLTAVSGANVTIVCVAVLLSAYLVGPRSAVVLAALALAMFVVVVGPTASVLRASGMAVIGLLAMWSGRRRHAVPALAATVVALLVFAPALAVDVGFALSAAATAALVVLAPAWSARLVGRGWPKTLADAVCVTVAAQLVTAPLIAAISGQISLISVLANLAVAIVIPPITLLGTAAAALLWLWQPGSELLIRFTGPELWWLLRVATLASRLPGAAVAIPPGWSGVVGVGVVSLASVLMWRSRWFRLVCGLAMLCLAAWSVSGLVGVT